MSRPLRIELAGALYRVTTRGDRREAIHADDIDRDACLTVLQGVCERFNRLVYAYGLLGNPHHLLIETPESNLSAGVPRLNGVYTQRANQRHGKVGHVLHGRYKAVLVHRKAHLLELARYVGLNPVRAGMVTDAAAWPWSSFGARVGRQPAPTWLEVDGLLAQFSARRAETVCRLAVDGSPLRSDSPPIPGTSRRIGARR